MIALGKNISILFIIIFFSPSLFSSVQNVTSAEVINIIKNGKDNIVDSERERYKSLIELNLTEIKNTIE